MPIHYETNWAKNLYGSALRGALLLGVLLTSGAGFGRSEALTNYPTLLPNKKSVQASVPLQTSIKGPLVFTLRGEDNNYDLYSMDPSSGYVKRLTDSSATDVNASISRDGNIVFTSEESDGTRYIIVMFNNGKKRILAKGSRILTSTQAWDPNGKRITYSDGNDIYIMDYDGRNKERLTSGIGPVWSPYDATKIAFIRSSHVKGNIHIIDLKKQEVYQITDTEDFAGPAWYSYEELIAHQGQVKVAGCLSAINWITKNIEPITLPGDKTDPPKNPDGCFIDHSPAPQGNKIIFIRSVKDDSWQIFMINRDGSRLKRLTDKGEHYAPTVIPFDDSKVGQSDLGLEDRLFAEKDGINISDGIFSGDEINKLPNYHKLFVRHETRRRLYEKKGSNSQPDRFRVQGSRNSVKKPYFRYARR